MKLDHFLTLAPHFTNEGKRLILLRWHWPKINTFTKILKWSISFCFIDFCFVDYIIQCNNELSDFLIPILTYHAYRRDWLARNDWRHTAKHVPNEFHAYEEIEEFYDYCKIWLYITKLNTYATNHIVTKNHQTWTLENWNIETKKLIHQITNIIPTTTSYLNDAKKERKKANHIIVMTLSFEDIIKQVTKKKSRKRCWHWAIEFRGPCSFFTQSFSISQWW